ncbi:type II toxin-antitoxin system RatA family toxin [Marinibactrum halimedae]|nr:type II toxin-antitoxin system RatA family toxin [Marinibactrum halimedae]MCD9459021.1 type II toxin-antitoxin system RatA family toxin [Marinibactrum halimedae]
MAFVDRRIGIHVTQINRSALVHYSCEKMFALINDIEKYPQFMDGCIEAKVLQLGENWLEARLTLAKAGIQHSFITRNQLRGPYEMTMTLVEGPFKKLVGQWQFHALSEEACKVSLVLSFEFKSRLLAMAAGKWFELMANKQVDALCKRAKQVYG